MFTKQNSKFTDMLCLQNKTDKIEKRTKLNKSIQRPIF